MKREGVDLCVPSAKFILRLQAFLVSIWRRGVTPTVAYQVWMIARHKIMDLRVEFRRAADVAHWMHVDPFSISESQLVGLAANIPRAQAQQLLQVGNFRPADYEYIYNLTLLATDDEQSAMDARSAAMKAYVDQSCRKGP